MRRSKAAIILLTYCLLSLKSNAISQNTSSTFSLELKVSSPALGNRTDVLVHVRIGTDRDRTYPLTQWGLAGLTRYFDSWYETAIEKLFKKLHMA